MTGWVQGCSFSNLRLCRMLTRMFCVIMREERSVRVGDWMNRGIKEISRRDISNIFWSSNMMTPKEIKEIRVLLNKLNDEELIALKDTVTKRQVAVEDRNGIYR